jgi:hypothetical protein
MAIEVYNPFETMKFSLDECFLTGQKINPETDLISVFPEWILKRYELHDKTFSMLLDGTKVQYQSMKLPCASSVALNSLLPLEKEIESAFTSGYEEVKKIPKERLFLWMCKLVYGILYHDFQIAIRHQEKRMDHFTLSDFLKNRFRNLHTMLQGLIHPITYSEVPFSIEIVKVKYSKDVFNYRDETNNLNFSLSMNGFGIVACLQDNGENSVFHNELVEKISEMELHPVQFEEICSRFIYSNYLLARYPEYKIKTNNSHLEIIATPFEGNQDKKFHPWNNEMFGQVLATYWKPWGLTMEQIVEFPNPPISFLISDYSEEIIDPSAIALPY